MNLRLFCVIAGILISTLVHAQDAPNKTDAAGKKQGHWIKFDDDKKKIYEGNFIDNIPDGKFTYFYDTGIPWSETVFSQNGKVARTKMFDAGGKLTGEGKYVNEKKDSLWKFYNQDGKLISDELYVNGLKNGVCKVYYADGQVAEEKTWKNGILEGSCKKYFESGQLKYSGQYINNKVEGKIVFYQPSGKIDAQGLYKNDVKEGVWNYYKEDGVTVKRTDKYVNGRMTDTTKDEISKEQEEQEKKNSEQFEIKDPYQEGYTPQK